MGNAMTNFRTAVLAVAVALAMTGSHALAEGMLAPGKPAGVQQAQHRHRNLLLIGGVTAAVVAGIAIAVTNSDNGSCTAANCPNQTASTSTTG